MDQVDVWLSRPLSAPPAALTDMLDAVERDRAETMDPARRTGFVTGRLLLRAALGCALGCAPDEVRLDSSCSCGRPHGPVSVLPTGPWVSVARHGPLVAVALRAAGPVGLDIASVSAVAAAPLTGVLSVDPAPGGRPADDGRLEGGAAGDRSLALAWVRTEATLKMLRTGLRRDPADVRIDRSGLASLDGRAAGRVLDLPWRPGLPDDAGDTVGAVAVDVPQVPELVLHDGAHLLAALLAGRQDAHRPG